MCQRAAAYRGRRASDSVAREFGGPMTRRPFAVAAAALIAATVLLASPAPAAEIKILSGSAVEPAMNELLPRFEETSGHKVRSDFDGAIGAMTERVRKGEAADVALLSRA